MVAKRSHHPPLHKEGRFAVCLICCFTAENRIKQFAYSISQSADADSSLCQREPCYLFDLKCWFAIKQVYQREPCNSFGLKCWFTTEQVQEREPILWFIWLTILHRFTDFQSTLPVFAKRSHHPPLHREGRFTVCWDIMLQRKTILNNLQFISVGYKITFV